MLALVLYIVGAPIIVSIVIQRFPAATPALYVVYAPLDYYSRSSLPGSWLFREYAGWCYEQLELFQ